MSRKKTFTFYRLNLDPTVLMNLRSYARDTNRSLAGLIREILTGWIESHLGNRKDYVARELVPLAPPAIKEGTEPDTDTEREPVAPTTAPAAMPDDGTPARYLWSLDPLMLAKLKSYAWATDRTVAALLRKIVGDWLGSHLGGG